MPGSLTSLGISCLTILLPAYWETPSHLIAKLSRLLQHFERSHGERHLDARGSSSSAAQGTGPRSRLEVDFLPPHPSDFVPTGGHEDQKLEREHCCLADSRYLHLTKRFPLPCCAVAPVGAVAENRSFGKNRSSEGNGGHLWYIKASLPWSRWPGRARMGAG